LQTTHAVLAFLPTADTQRN